MLRVYLDNCTFNRPFDDQTQVRIEIEAKAKISEKGVKGTIFLPFHYAMAAANKLTNAALDPTAKIPEFKVCAVRIEKV